MGKVSIVIDEVELQQIIDEAESKQTFKNETALFNYIIATAWAKNIKDELGRKRELTTALLYNRIKQFGIVLKTVKGKKGNPDIGKKLTNEEKGERLKNRPYFLTSVQHIRCNLTNHQKAKEGSSFKGLTPARLNLLKRHARGNAKSSIKLKCLECCCFEAQEAARCTVFGCPLYLLNPFLKAGVENIDKVLDEEDKENDEG